ncbi:MAG TPA: hypothetical protein PKA28_13595 [Methylomusa anaerophila]|uniref:Uncharacterized protein n=1 Tax=Methylomusa anaerophila TaxID=1930071 RepID=A0A348AKJ4_9FIRM|nr:hypothetical protein [Methylomusa anaerophila]BBB91592.1 hypothetical protein MAMMFC1_02276 [Methylomusa anaerophila]HML89470.1 hypothetical protein [Methylomusa anaerophila]
MVNLKKTMVIAVLVLFTIAVVGVTPVLAQAAESELTVIGKLSLLEKLVYGVPQTGALLDRTVQLEKDIYGQVVEDAIMDRVDKLYAYVKENSESAPSMLIKLNAAEWMFTHNVTNNPIKVKIENIERLLKGSPATGSLSERLGSLTQLAFSGGQMEVVAAILAKDTLVKVKTLSTLNSKQSRSGDTVALQVVDDVFIGGVLVIPKGSVGTGKVAKVEQAGNFGRDAKLEVSFDSVAAVDGATVPTLLGEKAKAETKSMATAAGASVAGMIVLGPVGIIGGAFVHGRDADIPIGSQLYVQTQGDMELYGIRAQ